MTYDRTQKQAGIYDATLSRAVGMAKAQWGKGWDNLTHDMKQAYVSHYLVGELGTIDFEAAFGDKVTTELEKTLLGRLQALSDVFLKAQTG